MLKFLINAISRAIGFTKTEARGTLVLITIIITALMFTHFRVNHIKKKTTIEPDSSAQRWIDSVHSSYQLKKPREKFDKSVYQPQNRADIVIKSEKPDTKKSLSNSPIVIGDLNLATVEELQKVKGIGPAYSERIVKYRDLLGGFVDTVQLKEVYGLKDPTISKLLDQFQIKSEVAPFDINSDSVKLLARHPYVSYDLAWVIINYRAEHGDIRGAKDLKKIKALDDSTFMRLKPYLE